MQTAARYKLIPGYTRLTEGIFLTLILQACRDRRMCAYLDAPDGAVRGGARSNGQSPLRCRLRPTALRMSECPTIVDRVVLSVLSAGMLKPNPGITTAYKRADPRTSVSSDRVRCGALETVRGGARSNGQSPLRCRLRPTMSRNNKFGEVRLTWKQGCNFCLWLFFIVLYSFMEVL